MKIENGQSILFTGDSITDCGRVRPVGFGNGLGEGYVAFANSLLASFYPERSIRILNTGISGNRVIDLEARWQTDVLDLTPDWLSVMIGINDVWRQFDSPQDPNQVSIERYETTYRKLLEQTRRSLKGLVMMTPYFIEPNPSDPMRNLMDAYSMVVKKLAQEFDAVFVDVQAAFDQYLAHRPNQSLCGDRVHPNKTGHMIIAKAFLTAIGFDWERN
jgi:lysophospholipase L1-like esterase